VKSRRVCVCVFMFFYPGGDVNLIAMHTDSWGLVLLWGPKVRSPWVNMLINHTELVPLEL